MTTFPEITFLFISLILQIQSIELLVLKVETQIEMDSQLCQIKSGNAITQ